MAKQDGAYSEVCLYHVHETKAKAIWQRFGTLHTLNEMNLRPLIQIPGKAVKAHIRSTDME